MSKKKHHFIPVFYLNQFRNHSFLQNTGKSGRLWVLSKNLKKSFLASPRDVAHAEKLYNVSLDNEDPELIETVLMKTEKIVLPIFKDICSGNYQIDKSSKAELSGFIAILDNRTFLAKESFEAMSDDFFRNLTFQFIKMEEIFRYKNDSEAFKKAYGYTPNELLGSLDNLDFRIANEFSMAIRLRASEEIAKTIFFRNWQFLIPQSVDRVFVTSDNPVIGRDSSKTFTQEQMEYPTLLQRWEIGLSCELRNPRVDLYFPLSSRICLFATCKEIDTNTRAISDEEVTFINRLIGESCHRQIYSSINDLHFLFDFIL